MSGSSVLEAREVGLSYGDTVALRGVNLSLATGERVALMGPSGSGKSSLLHCLAGIIRPTGGEVAVEGTRLDTMTESARSALRLQRIGVVFQFGDLVPELTLAENVMLPLQLLGRRRAQSRSAAMDLLAALDVDSVANKRAGTVSGGQAQRAAVARALVHQPAIVLADEPTGALDSLSAETVMDALVSLTTAIGAALLVVTHDNLVAAHLDRHLVMRDGAISDTVGAGR
ncbi:MAG TPA: ATP-binding cassette domain-containing protein [Actinomycetes bacterium]|nr:ATP-binding cassette domain-containing protein [Actinomycetes bacterium]